MMARLEAHAGVFKSAVLTGVEFDTSFLERDIDAFRAQAVLQIKPIGTHSNQYGSTVRVTYSATLFDSPSKMGLWAAKVEAPLSAQPSVPPPPRNAPSGTRAGAWAADGIDAGPVFGPAMDAAAEGIVGAMAADRMIGPVLVSNQL
jgi:hypothetical protein